MASYVRSVFKCHIFIPSRLAFCTIPGRKSFTGKGFKTCSRDIVLMFLERILEWFAVLFAGLFSKWQCRILRA